MSLSLLCYRLEMKIQTLQRRQKCESLIIIGLPRILTQLNNRLSNSRVKLITSMNFAFICWKDACDILYMERIVAA